MGLLQPEREQRFTLEDLKIVHGPPDRVLRKCVNLAERVLEGSGAVIAIRDVETRRTVFHSVGSMASLHPINRRFLLAGSLTERVCYEDTVIASTAGNEARWSASMPEIAAFHAKSFIASPIHDPADQPIGMLACFASRDANWRDADVEAFESIALMISQRIMLKAALKTVKLMSQDSQGGMAFQNITPVRTH